MQTFIIITLIFILLLPVLLVQHREQQKRIRAWLTSGFGEKKEHFQENWEEIANYWNLTKETLPKDQKIDTVTWNDLDMNRIFNRINSCLSFAGEQLLYHRLHCMEKSDETREELDQKISYYTANEDIRVDTQMQLYQLGRHSGGYYLCNFFNSPKDFSIDHIRLYRLLQALLVLPVIPAILFQNVNILFISLGIFLINLFVYSIKKNQYEIYLNTLTDIINLVKGAEKISRMHSGDYEQKFHDLSQNAAEFSRLTRMIGRMQNKKKATVTGDIAGMIYDYTIGATLWDFTQYQKIVRALDGKQQQFKELFETIGKIDMAISLASYRKSLDFYCTPLFTERKSIKAEAIYHPLINGPVTNDVSFTRSCIITGSNASGKSTFIKAVTVNAILAHSINTCCARSMQLPYTQVITSMAVRDDLLSGESYYIKEIKYLNRIIQSLDEERFVLCAIDEILKGTNTQERIAASAAILQYLADKNCLAIVASHDIELTRLLAKRYDNYHFRENIQENDIVFEYKLHSGYATTKNAIRLLEYVHFPQEIIRDARQRVG